MLIEDKPLWQMALTTNRFKCAAGQRFAAERGWGWASVANNGRTYRDLLLRELDNRTRETLTRALATGPISWTAMQLLRLRAPITALDVAAYAAQENVGLSLVPYRLGPDGPENTAVSHELSDVHIQRAPAHRWKPRRDDGSRVTGDCHARF